MNQDAPVWLVPEEEEDPSEDIEFTEYDISASPNDFNIKTLFDFIGSGVVKIPGFQRNYVWDLKRASKLIESIIIGIPIPQIFLFEEAKNKFSVIDGQQRYMTIYYFMKRRFPKVEMRQKLRLFFDENKGIPENILADNDYFVDFNLKLPSSQPGKQNRFNGLNYLTLQEDDRTSFELRTIRNIIIKQNAPDDNNSAVFEIFNRLNSGGVNLKAQEIRTSLYHSAFYDMLYRINLTSDWRELTSSKTPDLNMRDVEILLRGYAMLISGGNYKPSMTKFLNKFSREASKFSEKDIAYFETLYLSFFSAALAADRKIFLNKTGRFNISVFESIFVATCEKAFKDRDVDISKIDMAKVDLLKEDPEFFKAAQSDTASEKNVTFRISRAKEMLR